MGGGGWGVGWGGGWGGGVTDTLAEAAPSLRSDFIPV